MSLFEIPTQFRNFLNSAYQYLSPPQTPSSTTQNLPSHLSSPTSPHPHTPLSQRLHDACQSPTSTIAHLSPPSMRRELDITKHDLARANVDTLRLEERCKMLERSLKDTRDMLRAKEAEIERLRRDRDRDRAVVQQAAAERALSMRRASDAALQYTPQQSRNNSPSPTPHKGPRHASSLDTRMSSADLARQINGHRRLDDDPRSSSHSRSSTSSSSTSLSSSTNSRSSASTTRTPSPSIRTNGGRRATSPGANGGYSTIMPPPPPPLSSLQGLTSISEDRARMRSNETYMTRSDTWSGAQVLQAVHDINAEILQFAASATELCTYSSFSPSAPHSQPALNDTVSRLGTAMTQILATRDHSSDPLLVQLALQGAVNLCLSRALASFIPGFPSKSDALLTNIYSEMRRCEPQPTSARWAALTSGYVHRLYPTLMEYAVGELAETMVRWCADVFLVARCVSLGSGASHSPSSSPKVQSTLSAQMSSANAHQSLLQSLRSSHLPALTHIARSALALSKLTREEIMSTTFQVVVVDPLAASPSSPSTPTINGHRSSKPGGGGVWKEGEMTDAFAEYYPETPTHGASSHHKAQNMDRGRVVATIELGLRCVTRVAAPIPTSPDVDTHVAAQGGVPAALAAKLDATAGEWGLANGGWYGHGGENGITVNGSSNGQKAGGGSSGLSVMNGGMQNNYGSSSSPSPSSSSSITAVQSSHHQHQQLNGGQQTNGTSNSSTLKTSPSTTTSMSGASTETTFETRLLLLPKVVLEGVVDVLDR